MKTWTGLAEIFPSGAWEINRRVENRPRWLAEYRDFQRRTVGSRVFFFRPSRTCDEVRAILVRYMRRVGIEPADTVSARTP